MARDINKLKDKLHAVKGLDSSSAYTGEDEEQKKKKQAEQAKKEAQTGAVREALLKTRNNVTAQPKYTTYEAPLKESGEVQTRSAREAMSGKEKERATSGKSVNESRQDRTTSTLHNIGEALKASRAQSRDVERTYNDLSGLAAGAKNAAKESKDWAAEAAEYGNNALKSWYQSAEKQLTATAANAQRRMAEMLSPASRQQEVENENTYARLLDYWTDKAWGTGERQATEEEITTGAGKNESFIADLEKKQAAGTITSAEERVLQSLYKAREAYDSGNVSVYDNDIDEAQQAVLDSQQGYLQSRANVDFLAGQAQQKMQEISDRQTVPVVLDRMQQAGASVEDYKAEREALYQDYMNAGGLKTVFKKDYDLLNYTPEQYAAYRWTEENEPEKLDNLKEYLDISANARISQDAQEYWSDSNRADGMNNIFGNTVLGITGRLSGLINTADIALQSLAVAGGARNRIDYNRTGWGVQGGEEAVSAQAEKLAELGSLGDRFDGLKDTWLGELNLGDLYRNGVDSAVSILNGGLFGKMTGLATSGQVFAGAYADAKERGASDKQAGLFAAFSSAAEGAGEQVSFGVFQKLIVGRGMDKKAGGKILLGLIQKAEEGGQELVTEELDILADRFIMQELSQEEQQAQAYMAQGYDPDTAREIAKEENNERLMDAALSGFIGGAMRSGGAYAAQGISNAAGSVQTAFDDRARGRQIQKMGNAQQMAQLMSEVTGETVTPETNKRKLGKQQREFIENAGEYVSRADEATRDIVRGKVYDVANASAEALDGTSQAAKEKAGKRSAAMKTSDTGASVGGESVTVQGFVKTAEKGSDAKLNIKKADGTLAEANMEDVTFDSKTSEVYSYAADMATPELANDFRMRIQPDQMGSIERVANGYSQAYDMAKAGFKETSIRASSLTGALTDDQVSAAYKLGAEARKSEQIATIAKAAERAKANMGNEWKGGKATFDDSVVVDALDDTQKAQIDVASVFTGSMGVNVEFFESKADETGRFTRENGSYNRKTNTIYIDVNAGRYYKGDSPSKTALLRTLSHEVTHAVQRNSPEIYAELRDTVTDILGDAKGVTIEDLIDRKMAADSSLTTRDAAMDELVADACERMIEDSDAAQRLVEAHPEAAKTIFEKVGELLTKLKDAIKAAFKGRQLSTEAQLVMKDVERYQKMVDLWTKGVMQTAEVSGREYAETEAAEDESTAISEETAAVSEEVTSGKTVGLYDEPARPAEVHIDNRTWEADVNPDIQKQTRDEAISTRYALANMLEADATNSEEVAWLRGYKGQLNELDMVLDAIEGNRQTVRELMFEEKTLSDGKKKLVMRKRTPDETERLKKAQNRIKILQEQVARMDEGLLNLENADVIRNLVEREAQKIRDREAEKRREGIAKVRENQRNTSIRKNIQRRAKRIDRMLRQPTDKEHIPEGLKGAILDMMEIFVGDGPAFGGSKADVLRAYRAQQEYEAMRGNEDYADLASRYDEDTSERLKQLATLMNDKDIAKFDNADLTLLSTIIEHFEHLIRDQNDAFTQSRRKITEGYAEQIWQQTMTMKGRKENAITGNALVKALKHLGHANVIPPYFFKRLGGAMGKLGNDLLKAEGRYGVNMNKAVSRLAEIREEYEHDKWATKKGDILKLETKIGDRLELTREQALGIWASAKRERLNTVQRATHLRDGGVILEKTARKLGIKGQEINVTPTKISQRDIQQIDKWLTDQQKQYADAMVGYISRDMAALGNETSMELVGYKKFGEGYYYPYKTSGDFRRTELGKVEDALIKNMGFTKSVTRGAKTPVVITDFSATVADHVNAMIMYNAFAVAQDQLMRVYDFKLDDSASVKNLLRNAYGDEIPAYIEQLMRDLYGGVSPDRDAGLVNWLVSAHKKQAVLGSLSVVVQQPTALIRAMSQINPKYFVGQKTKGGFNEAMDYAGTAVIKDIGGFDSGVGRGATDWLNGSPKDWRNHAIKTGLDTVSDWAGLGAEYADKLAWTAIWKAVKREQAAKYKMDINSPELKEIAGERFDEVVRLTQVYDSVMTRSQLMRNKNVFWKGATSFMSEPTVTWNMLYDAGIEAFKNKKGFKAGGIFASVLVSTILTNLAKATVTAARDDDDEEATYLERYVKNAAEGLINDVVPFNYMPIVRDIYSKLQGYEVERADMGIINDILAAGEVILNDEKKPIDKVKSLVELLSIMTGLPGKNIWRDVEAAFNTAGAVPQSEARPGWLENALRTGMIDATPIGKWFNLTDSKTNNADRMYKAIREGDYAEAEDQREHLILYNNVKDDKAVDSLLRTRIKDGFTAGEIGADEAIELLTGYAGMSDIKARDTVAEWKYTSETGEPYSKLKEQFLEGEITSGEAIAARQEYGDAYEADAEQTIAEWQYEKDTGRAWSDMKYDYISGDMTAKEVIAAQKKYADAFEWDVKAQILKWDYERDKGRPYNEMKAAYIEGDITAKEAIADRVKYGGMYKEDAELDISKWNFEIDYGYPYDDMKDYYRLGRISKDKAIAARVKYGKQEQDEAYFAVTGWEYEQSEGKEWHGKFTKVHDAIDSGNDNALIKAIKEVYENSAYEDGKKAASALTSNITSTYKPVYIEASEAKRAQMEEDLLEAYRLAYELAGEEYYGDSKKLKAIRKWLEEDE